LAAETDPAKVVTIANQIDRLMWDDLYTIPLFQRQAIISYNSDIVNIRNNPTYVGLGWNANEWELKR
jgi:peptide/nickel transport system substrate-binding protein